jgi:hypothetical protein
MGSLDGSRAAVSSGFSLCDPRAAVSVPPFLSYSSGALRVWCSDDKVPIPCLYVPYPWRLPDHAAAASLADSAAKVPIPRIPPRSALVLSDSDDEVLIPRLIMLSCVPSTSRPFVHPRPARQASGRGRCSLGYG